MQVTESNHPSAALLQFLNDSPTPFHVVENVVARLQAAGYSAVDESSAWPKRATGKVYFTRNDSSLVAVDLNCQPAEHGFRLVGAHTDSPCLKVKPNAITYSHGYAKLAVEVYGGALLNPWFDRDLGLAGRVTIQSGDGKLQNHLLNTDRPVAFIPSLAIHLDRDANHNRSINAQKELSALFGRTVTNTDGQRTPNFTQFLISELMRNHPDLSIDKVFAHELCLYDCQSAQIIGLEHEFIAAARLDNLLSCYAGMEALLAVSEPATATPANHVLVLNDHEEVGSTSASGADGPFLHDVLHRLCGDQASLARALHHSVLVSVDNAHGVHPNYADKHEPNHQPLLNEGVVIKINSNQRYATNCETAALFQQICAHNNLPYQTFVMRSDLMCGTTIGPITAAKLGIRTLDIGVPQLGMHSIRELAGLKDQHTLRTALIGFYQIAGRPFG